MIENVKRRFHRLAWLVVMIFSLFPHALLANDNAPAAKELEELDIKFRNDLVELQKPLKVLLNQYVEQLGLAKIQYQQAGELKAVLAFEREIQDIKEKGLENRAQWREPEDPIIIKKRQEYMTKHAAMVNRNHNAVISVARNYADKLSSLVTERTKAGKLEEAQAFQSRLEDLKTTVTIYREPEKAVDAISPWVKQALEWMQENPQLANVAMPTLPLAGDKAGEAKKIQLSQDVSMDFCWCPPGDFVMGSPLSEQGREKRENQVNVKITKGFWMGKYEVTQEQWKAVMGNSPSFFQGESFPVDSVNWTDTQEFLKRINKVIIAGKNTKFALPTEAQWEYACRAGEKTTHSNKSIVEMAWFKENSGAKTHIVGTKKPNSWGLHDMLGNVFEWCSDWYSEKLIGGEDPTGPKSGLYRVAKGCCCHDFAASCRPAYRYYREPTNAGKGGIGFRIIISLDCLPKLRAVKGSISADGLDVVGSSQE